MDWRERKKAQTRVTIQDHALRLFTEKGYENTTVEEIATAAGVSHMTFFRYFPRKEAVITVDEYLRFPHTVPEDGPPLTAVHRAIRDTVAEILANDADALLARIRIITRTPELHPGQNLVQHELAGRLADRGLADLTAQVLASTAIGALMCATSVWVSSEGELDYLTLIDQAFEVVGVPGR